VSAGSTLKSIDLDRARAVQESMPSTGLFAGKEWLVSPEPFLLSSDVVDQLERLGHWLFKFVRATNRLYFQSVKGKKPSWIKDYFEAGKPADLIQAARANPDVLPAVIRPDIILTEQGWTITELDSVPGGIGLTDWLNQTYSDLGFDVIGTRNGMVEGFSRIFPRGVIAVSDESATYRPEMQWLVERLRSVRTSDWEVVRAEDWAFPHDVPVYRFFELFDLGKLQHKERLFEGVLNGNQQITPPLKPFLEEKLAFGLFWSRPLAQFWRRELSDRHWKLLRRFFPHTWILDPTPLPHNAVIPGLEVQDWSELKHFSQKQRELVLKISGFSERAWGSRGVHIAPDLPHHIWAEQIDKALAAFSTNPYILQRFYRGGLFEQKYFDTQSGEIRVLRGRVRLCPYYFVVSPREVVLGGVLATIVPPDKKIVHGMRDAIMVPAAVAPE
jgi:hypothetical protein